MKTLDTERAIDILNKLQYRLYILKILQQKAFNKLHKVGDESYQTYRELNNRLLLTHCRMAKIATAILKKVEQEIVLKDNEELGVVWNREAGTHTIYIRTIE